MTCDNTCPKCGKVLQSGEWPFCGGRNNHGFPIGTGISVIDDQLEGGPRRFETMGDDAPYIETKSQWRREVKLRNLVPFDRYDRATIQKKFKMHDERLRDTGRAD